MDSHNGCRKAIIRYTVYAIPSAVNVEEAQAADGDGFNADYLVDVTYSPSFTLPSDKTSGYWYAVCVYDGYGFESEPSIVNYSGVKSEATTLVSPKGGTTVSWDVTLKWNAISGSTYTVQVATDSDFRNLVMNSTTTSTETVMNCDELAETLFATGASEHSRRASWLYTQRSRHSVRLTVRPHRQPNSANRLIRLKSKIQTSYSNGVSAVTISRRASK